MPRKANLVIGPEPRDQRRDPGARVGRKVGAVKRPGVVAPQRPPLLEQRQAASRVPLGQRQGRQRAGQPAPHHDEIEIHAGGNGGAASRRLPASSPPRSATARRRLNDRGAGEGKYVLYWMQQSQRARCNHALQFAVARADALGLPLLVGFGLTDYPEANLRSYQFMLDGLRETAAALADRGIGFVLRRGAPDQVALALGADAAAIVCDRGYLRHQRRWRRQVADQAACEVTEVEADAVVPVVAASDKAEFAARTLRPRIHRLLDRFLRPLRERAPRRAFSARPRGLGVGDPAGAAADAGARRIGARGAAARRHRGGARAAARVPAPRTARLRPRPGAGRRLVGILAEPVPALRADLPAGGGAGGAGQRGARRRPDRVPGTADRPARAGPELLLVHRGLRPLRFSARVGPGHAAHPRGATPAASATA